MRIVRPICCGADIHKDLIVATIAATNQDGITEYIQSSFSSQNFDLIRLKAWLIEHHCFEIAMESTGKYWIPVFNVLEDEIKVSVVHPKYTKAIKGKKTDKKDSKWIADLFKHNLLKFSFRIRKNTGKTNIGNGHRILISVSFRGTHGNQFDSVS